MCEKKVTIKLCKYTAAQLSCMMRQAAYQWKCVSERSPMKLAKKLSFLNLQLSPRNVLHVNETRGKGSKWRTPQITNIFLKLKRFLPSID